MGRLNNTIDKPTRKRKQKHEKEYPHAKSYFDRHGNRRWRIRFKKRSHELGREYGSQEFDDRYKEGLVALGIDNTSNKTAVSALNFTGSVASLIDLYESSPTFKLFEESTKRNYRSVNSRFRADKGSLPIAKMEKRHVVAYLDTISKPGAANKMLRQIKTLLNFGVMRGLILRNVTVGIPDRDGPDRSFTTWTEAEIAKFLSATPEMSTAWIAFTVMLYTGAARCDAVKLGWDCVYRDDNDTLRIKYSRGKTKVSADIPVHRDLEAVLQRLDRSKKTFLETAAGKIRSSDSLGNEMREAIAAAGLVGRSSHGLRKAMGRRLAEAGATAHQIMAVLALKTLAEAQRYCTAFGRKESANEAIAKVEAKFSSSDAANRSGFDALRKP